MKQKSKPGKEIKKLRVFDVLARAFKKAVSNFLPLAGIAAVSFLPGLLYMLSSGIGKGGSFIIYIFFLLPVIYLISIVFSLLFSSLLLYAGYLSYEGKKIDYKVLFSLILKRWYKLLAAMAMSGVIAAAGFLLLLPGIYFLVSFAFVSLAALSEKDDVKPLHYSMEAVKGNFLPVLALLALVSLPVIVLTAVIYKLSVIPGSHSLFPVFVPVFMAVSVFASVAIGGMYSELKKIRKQALGSKSLLGSNDNAGCLISVAAAFVAAGAAGAVFMVMYQAKTGSGSAWPEIKPVCSRLEIEAGEGVFSKKMLWQDEHTDVIYDAAQLSGNQKGLIIASDRKLFITDEKMNEVKRSQYYQEKMCRPLELTDIDGDGMPELLKSTTRERYIIAMNTAGEEVFRYRAEKDTLGYASFGDLDGDGSGEFAINFHNRGRIDIVSWDGKIAREINEKPEGMVYMTDYDNDGKDELLFKDKKGNLILAGGDGKIINSCVPVKGPYYFFPVSWTGADKKCIMIPQQGKLLIFDYFGVKKMELQDSSIYGRGNVRALLITEKDKNEYLAVIVNRYDSTSLMIFRYSGGLEYKEKLNGNYTALSAYKNGFIIGGEGRVYYYERK